MSLAKSRVSWNQGTRTSVAALHYKAAYYL